MKLWEPPEKMPFTVTIDFSLTANYPAYPSAILALYQFIVQRLMNQQISNDCNLRIRAYKPLLKVYVVLISPRRLRQHISELTWSHGTRSTFAKIPIASRNGEVAARAGGSFRTCKWKVNAQVRDRRGRRSASTSWHRWNESKLFNYLPRQCPKYVTGGEDRPRVPRSNKQTATLSNLYAAPLIVYNLCIFVNCLWIIRNEYVLALFY